jgi:sugar (pentulose or hexulose) kinase
MTGSNILAIDNGTQSVRALLFSPTGALLAKSRVLYEPYFSKQPGWAEQEPELFWQKICQACKNLFIKENVNPESIAGVALTTQRSTLINLDKDMNPLRPAMHWLDQRVASKFKRVRGLWGLAFDLFRLRETIDYFQSQAEANYLAENDPEMWEKTDKFVFLSGYLTHKLTGELVDSVASQVGFVPFDYKKLTWASQSDWKWQALPPIMPELLVPLKPPGDILGYITPEASQATGIPVGLPLIAAAADKACEVLGAGCLSPDKACLSFGTTATVNTTQFKYYEVIPLVPPYPAAVPNAYNLEVQIYRGYWMIEWFIREFGHTEQTMADQMNIEVELLLDDLINHSEPGAMGLVLQPYWSPGLKFPGPEAKGAIIGFGDVHNRSHVYRAIIEGLAYGLREGLERTVKRTRQPVNQIVVAGGGSQSRSAVQTTADIFGLPVAVPSIYEASGLGAAIDAAVGLGIHSDFSSAVKEMTSIGEIIEPDHNNHRLYNDLYYQVYKKLYRKLQPLYEKIRDITGYPAQF